MLTWCAWQACTTLRSHLISDSCSSAGPAQQPWSETECAVLQELEEAEDQPEAPKGTAPVADLRQLLSKNDSPASGFAQPPDMHGRGPAAAQDALATSQTDEGMAVDT